MCPTSPAIRPFAALSALLMLLAAPLRANDGPPSPEALFSSQSGRQIAQQGLQPLSTQLPDTRVRPGLLPPDASEGLFQDDQSQLTSFRGSDWAPVRYEWVASELRYRPLYFEDAMLERHGQTRHPVVQPLVSGSRFFLTFPALPYAMAINSPRPAQSTLGHFRPGSAAPVLLQRPPLQADASLLEAGVWVGFIFLIP